MESVRLTHSRRLALIGGTSPTHRRRRRSGSGVAARLAEALPTLPWPETAGLSAKLPFWRQWQKLLFDGGFAGLSSPLTA